MVLGANIRVTALPADYRWASAVETEAFDTLPDAIQVIRGGNDDDGTTMTDIAMPAIWPVALDWRPENDTAYYCTDEFEAHSDHTDCSWVWENMMNPYSNFDPMDDIPYGTPDSWIPDNPDDNGMRMSDFI